MSNKCVNLGNFTSFCSHLFSYWTYSLYLQVVHAWQIGLQFQTVKNLNLNWFVMVLVMQAHTPCLHNHDRTLWCSFMDVVFEGQLWLEAPDISDILSVRKPLKLRYKTRLCIIAQRRYCDYCFSKGVQVAMNMCTPLPWQAAVMRCSLVLNHCSSKVTVELFKSNFS